MYVIPYSDLSDSERAEVEAFDGGVKLYSIKQVAAILGLTTRTINRYIKGGSLPAVKVGGRWRIRGDALQRMVDDGK